MIRRMLQLLAQSAGLALALVAPGLLPLLRYPVTVRRCLAFLLGASALLNLLLWVSACPPALRTFDLFMMVSAPNIEGAFLGKLGDAQQSGDAIILVAEVGRGSIRFQRLEPIVGSSDPVEPQPHFWLFFWIFIGCYAGGVLSSLRDWIRDLEGLVL